MHTLKGSLRDNIDIFLNYINLNQATLDHNEKIYNILEGNLLPYVLDEMKNQLSAKAFNTSKGRVAPINVLRRIVNKLSRIYSEPAGREPVPFEQKDQDLIDDISLQSKIDSFMQEANEYFNAAKTVALQPYYIKDKNGFYVPRIRVIPPHLFLPFSDDSVDPLNMTHFIKAGKIEWQFDKDKNPIPVKTYDIYSASEYLPIDQDGKVLTDRLVGNNGINPFGEIPFIYINRSRQELIPQIDTDVLAMTILVPILLTDLNFAVQFMSHSILYGIDLVPGALEMNPNAFWLLKSEDRENASPSVGSIKPDVDTDKVITLVKEQVSLWLESRNIKPGKGSLGTVESASSGIALLIEEADTTEDRKIQVNFFRAAEEKLWNLYKIMNNYYADQKEEKTKFNDDFEVNTSFSEQNVIEDANTKIDRISKELDKKLTSRFRAISELNPEMSDEEIEELIEEIDEENTYIEKTPDMASEGGNNGEETSEAGEEATETENEVGSEEGESAGENTGAIPNKEDQGEDND